MAITQTYSTVDVLTFSYTTSRNKYLKPQKKERKGLKFCPYLNITLHNVRARSCCVVMFHFCSHGMAALVGQGLIIIEDSRSHSGTPHTVGLLWTSDRTRRRDLHLTTHSTRNRQTSVPPTGFQPMIPVSKRLQTHVLDHEATGIDVMLN